MKLVVRGCLVVAVFTLVGCAGLPSQDRFFDVVSINDVYNIEGVDARTRGGLARVRTLREQLRGGEPVLLLHAGDFLFPSQMSEHYEGAQMIDMMNLMDGDATGFDDRFFVTFGNHEFDKRRMLQAQLLAARIEQSDFIWLGSNVSLSPEATRDSDAFRTSLRDQQLLDVNGIRVGLFSLTTDIRVPEYADIDTRYVDIAREQTAALRAAGAEVVIGLTHLRLSQDVQVLQTLGEAGPDVVFGGHEHQRMYECAASRCVYKADAEARSAVVARIRLSSDGAVSTEHRFLILDDTTIAADSLAEALSDRRITEYENAYCGDDPGCLRRPIGRTAVDLIAEEEEIRRYETNIGAFIADQMISAFDGIELPDGRRVQVALNNSGSIRLNQNIPAGTALNQWYLRALLPYRVQLRLIDISGAQLRQAVEHSVEDWTGNGWWLQGSGFAFRHDVESGRATDVSIRDNGQWRAVNDDERILAVVSGYLVDANGDQDGYTMLSLDREVVYGDSLFELDDLVDRAIRDAWEDGDSIAPVLPGRVCSSDRPNLPCVLD